jgi:hypothetical protein
MSVEVIGGVAVAVDSVVVVVDASSVRFSPHDARLSEQAARAIVMIAFMM